MTSIDSIVIRNASENNLRSVSLEIPRNKLVVVTGVSGSGKSSLVFDVLYREAEFRYFGSFTTYARQFLGKMKRPEVESISGLSPAIAIEQKPVIGNQRSTVGTLTGIWDYLRLLYARTGEIREGSEPVPVNRSLFSFNAPAGACHHCNGLGVEDMLDPELLIADNAKSLRDGALVITAPNGYIIYSQVTMEVLDQVCRSEGFHVDIPWRDLSPEQKHIVLYGSNRIEIPYGKHPLESRMRWTGITARPREMGTYKGIIPVMENILKRDRNKNILRFVRTGTCPVCHGSRLNGQALSVEISGFNIGQLATEQLDELQEILQKLVFSTELKEIARSVIVPVVKRIGILKRLGLGHLTLHRGSTTLSGGESQRLRLAAQAVTGLQNVLYLFDEPSVGLHPADTRELIDLLKELRDQGNSVVVVEHDEAFIRHADWLIDVGPGPGIHGGEIVLNTDTGRLPEMTEEEIRGSSTLSYYFGRSLLEFPTVRREGTGELIIEGAAVNNLKNLDVMFRLGTLNVVTGVSGAGKSSLVMAILGRFLRQHLHGSTELPGRVRSVRGWESITKVISIDQSPIGRTPRSNPATYTGLFDHVRDLFAGLLRAKALGFDKSRFSFNTPGGRCEPCQGAGYQQIGMHFMGTVEILCESCNGRRFDSETLGITYRDKNISEILELSVSEAMKFFHDQPQIRKYLETLDMLGLGYLTLGQRSSTLSGGEAQRVKLATELVKPPSRHTLYILDEPTTGLHQADINRLLKALNDLVGHGHTVILIEHHLDLIASADHIVDLGPGSGRDGGALVFSGTPGALVNCLTSVTGRALCDHLNRKSLSGMPPPEKQVKEVSQAIRLTGVTTHNLKNVDVEIPNNKITVLTGVSGSGKSSLAFDTIHAEGQNRFLESFSTYARTRIGLKEKPDFETVTGLMPTLAVDQRTGTASPRSTVGTSTGLYDLYRLLYSRIGVTKREGERPFSSLFSFNHQSGACSACEGLGKITVCDPEKLITHPDRSILAGAMDGTKTGKFYGDPFGQYVATLQTVGRFLQIDFARPWSALADTDRKIALHGTGDIRYDVAWSYKRKQRSGEHHFKGVWQGMIALVNDEYNRKHADHRGESIMGIMKHVTCTTCNGTRLKQEALEFLVGGTSIAELSAMTVAGSIDFLIYIAEKPEMNPVQSIALPVIREILRRLEVLSDLGLSYITIDRPSSGLSGGEVQRIKLAGQIGSGLTGLTYVLDEPTMGLHPSETDRLMKLVTRLKEAGNTVVIVEHDRKVIRSADYVIDLGPGAGVNGGTIVATGTPEELMHDPRSVTGKYLSFEALNIDTSDRPLGPGLQIYGACANNLKNLDLEIPSGGIVVITGVSGSGKSSLLYDVILQSWKDKAPRNCDSIDGFELFHQLVFIPSKSHFPGSMGTPVTYTGIFDPIRNLFAGSPGARRMNFGKEHFSFMSRQGRCEHCQGSGELRVSMDFLSDIPVLCEHCRGKRYREEVLACNYNGKNIDEVLSMTFVEAEHFFTVPSSLAGRMGILEKVGLGYLKLGQPLDTLSGGEAQRLVLASELMKPAGGKNLYVLDEPSTGLHFSDIITLSNLFSRFVENGHTLLMIENDPDLIVRADWIIDLGPGQGVDGGEIVTRGRLSGVLANKGSLTAEVLRHYGLTSS